MRKGLQAAIDEVEAKAEKYDAIALGYGLCGNGLAGSGGPVHPPGHASGARLHHAPDGVEGPLRSLFPRSYGGILPLRRLGRTRGRPGAAGADADRCWASRSTRSIEKYGEDNGRFLYDELTRYQQNYQQLTFIETGIEPDDRFETQARAEAAEKGWKFEKLGGDLALFRELLSGHWDEAKFLVVRPGQRIVARPDQGIVAAEEVAP